jgi:hypothetical protein
MNFTKTWRQFVHVHTARLAFPRVVIASESLSQCTMATNSALLPVPIDALHHILAYVNRRKDVASCMQVSRSWKVRVWLARRGVC